MAVSGVAGRRSVGEHAKLMSCFWVAGMGVARGASSGQLGSHWQAGAEAEPVLRRRSSR